MAVQFKDSEGQEIGKRVNAYNLDPREVIIMPELNGRHELPEIETLIADMLSKPDGKCIKGQTTPVIIRKDGTKPVLVAGHRRLRAILEINKRKLTPQPLPLLCSYMQLTPVEALAVAVTENRERAGVTPMDEAYCIKQFIRLGKDHEWIAQFGGFFPGLGEKYANGAANGDGNEFRGELKKAVAWVKKREKLLGLDPVAEKALADGTLKPSAAEHLAELEQAKQRELVEKGNVTPADIRAAAGKPATVTPKVRLERAKEELDNIVSEFGANTAVKELIDRIQALRDRL